MMPPDLWLRQPLARLARDVGPVAHPRGARNRREPERKSSTKMVKSPVGWRTGRQCSYIDPKHYVYSLPGGLPSRHHARLHKGYEPGRYITGLCRPLAPSSRTDHTRHKAAGVSLLCRVRPREPHAHAAELGSQLYTWLSTTI
ncbi:uncharacterized protein LY79DRAFT_572806, partial [Colletotrichum navitas]